MNISFLTSSHYYNDDRIFYHMAKSLFAVGNKVEVICSKTNKKELFEGIQINSFDSAHQSKKDKIGTFISLLQESKPDVIICSEPLTVLAAKQYKRKASKKPRVLYDITEWYPSKKNLNTQKNVLKIYTFLKLLVFNFYVSFFADGFIFGEWYKSKPYKFIYRTKPFVYTTYYPDLNFIQPREPVHPTQQIQLCYSGKISKEKGYINFMRVVGKLSEILPTLLINVKIIGWYESEKDKRECEAQLLSAKENVSLTFYPKQSYEDYIKLITSTDIFLDLRSDDYENQRCLPIKLFYYLALGRPVIYSNLKAIRKEVEIEKFGSLVDPHNAEGVADIIMRYVVDKDFYLAHCKYALEYSHEKYNWQKTEPSFLNFIQSV